jgi:hypothetical protein
MNAESLARALLDIGIDADVEPRGAMAVVRPRSPSVIPELARAERRREVVALGATCGFTHVALELVAHELGTG